MTSSSIDRRLIAEARPARAALVLSAVTSAALACVIVVQARLLSEVIQRAFLESAARAAVSGQLLALALVIGLRAGLNWANALSAAHAAITVKNHLRQRFMRHVAALGPAYIREERSGELVLTATGGIEKLDAYFRDYLPGLLSAVIVPLILLGGVLPLDWLTFAVLLVTGPLIPLFMALIGMAAGTLAKRQFQEMSFLGAHFLDVVQGLTTLKLFNRSQHQEETIARITDRFRAATMRVLRVAFLSALSLEMLSTLSVAIVAVEIGLRLLDGGLRFDQALFLLILAPEFYLPLRALGAKFHAGTEGKGAAERLFEVLDTPTAEANSSATAQEAIRPPLGIAIDDLSFAYAGDDRPALDHATFTMEPGQSVALVGLSGSGKTTLTQLLLRFIAPESGRIVINGVDLADLPADSWRKQIAWVPQNPYLFNTTIAENICVGRLEASLDAVIAAAEAAGAHEFIRQLPQGYETPCGERGLRLSGGQAQRIAIARAFLRDAPLLILDEATAQLDTETERQIQAALDRLKTGRTVLLIAHRLNTVMTSDRLVVLAQGRVAEQGTPADLIARGGDFARMLRAGQGGEAAMNGDATPVDTLQSDSEVERGAPFHVEMPDSEVDAPASDIHTLRRLLALIRPYGRGMALSVVLGTLTIASSIGLMATSAWMISKSALRPSIAELGVSVVAVRFFGISRGVLRYLERLVSHETTFRLLAGVRVAFFRAIEPLAPAGLSALRSGDLLGRMVDDIESLQNIFLRAAAPPLVALVVTLCFALFLGAFDGLLALDGLLLMLGAGLVIPYFVLRASDAIGRQRVSARAALQAALVDAVQGAADSAAYGYDHILNGRLDAMAESLAGIERRFARYDGLQGTGYVLLANLAALVILTAAIGRVEGVFLATLTLATVAVFEAFMPLGQAAAQLGANVSAARRLFEIVDRPPVVKEPVQPAPLPASYDLQIRDVTFRYTDDAPPALSDLSLSIPAGARVAIVGSSGSGKSTLVNLLARFWEPDAGDLLLGGTDLRTLALHDVRESVGVMEQRTHLFHTTIRENIRIGRADAAENDILAAARAAQFHEFITSLPEGYGTLVGENGVRLSAGERQRLALARVLLKNSPLLVLDEPTGNLDAVNERAILGAVLSQTEGRTLILLTHRFALLDAMDTIFVLEAGRLVEQGTHAALLKVGGRYRRLYEASRAGLTHRATS